MEDSQEGKLYKLDLSRNPSYKDTFFNHSSTEMHQVLNRKGTVEKIWQTDTGCFSEMVIRTAAERR